MKLPFFSIPFFNKKPAAAEVTQACHFGLRISTSQIQAVIWQESPQGKPQILCRSRYLPWDTGDLKNLATQADLALAECVAHLPENLEEPNDVLLGLPADWVQDGQLVPEYRQALRDLTKTLDLQAMGFVVTMEALVNYLNSLGTGAVSAILIGIDDRLLEIGLSIQGQIQQVVNQSNTADLLAGVMHSLEKLDASHLPPKIILFDGDMDLTRLQQSLIHQDWESKQLGFLHLPEVTYVPEHLPSEAIVYSSTTPVQQGSVDENTPYSPASSIPHEVAAGIAESEPGTDPVFGQPADSLAALGFVKNEDIKAVAAPAWEGLGTGDEIEAASTPATDGLPMDHATQHQRLVEARRSAAITPIQAGGGEIPLQRIEEKPSGSITSAAPVVKKDLNQPPKLKLKRPIRFRIPWRILLVVVVLLSLLAGGGVFAYSRTQAEVTLYVEPQLLEKAFSVKVNPSVDQSDPENGVVKGQLMTIEVSGTQTVPTTGKTTVGESATGEVTIFNDTDTDRTLAAGTTITATEKQLVFSLDREVTIASKSVDLAGDSPFKPGQAKVKVTAGKIGPEYNLSGQTAFSVANFSSTVLLARNDQEFSGGSSREIQAVGKADIESATSQLLSSLETQAKEKLQQQLGDQLILVDDSVVSNWADREFSHKAGDETAQLTLEGSLELEAVAYSEADFHTLANARLSAELPSDKSMSEYSDTDFKLVNKGDDNSYNFDVVTKTYLLPKIDVGSVAEKLTGKTPQNTETFLKSLPAVKEVESQLKPELPGVLRRYPFNAEQITVTIVHKSG